MLFMATLTQKAMPTFPTQRAGEDSLHLRDGFGAAGRAAAYGAQHHGDAAL